MRMRDQLLVAVFDGHGDHGQVMATRARDVMQRLVPSVLFKYEANGHEGIERGFHDLFAQCQAALVQEPYVYSGTTVSCALVDPSQRNVVFAHVGDSKVVLAHEGALVFATQSHTFDVEAERRISASGGEVRMHRGARRVFARGGGLPGLAMSRTLGDLEGHRVGMTAVPTVSPPLPFKLGSDVIAATDGVWDVMPMALAVAGTATAPDAASAAALIVSVARGYWERAGGGGGDIDDITAVVVKS